MLLMRDTKATAIVDFLSGAAFSKTSSSQVEHLEHRIQLEYISIQG